MYYIESKIAKKIKRTIPEKSKCAGYIYFMRLLHQYWRKIYKYWREWNLQQLIIGNQ